LAPHIVKGTYVVVEGSGGVNAYMKNGEAAAVIRCMVNSLEFGGKPTTGENPKVTEATTFKPESDFPF
jgi:hypothetical protein